MSKINITVSQEGVPLTETCEGYTMPANYGFERVNDYVHSTGREFEELQCLCLAMANVIDGLHEQLEIERLTVDLIGLNL